MQHHPRPALRSQRRRRPRRFDPPRSDRKSLFRHIPQHPPSTRKIGAIPTSLTTSLIRLTFPLIRQCEVTVNISKKIWDLSPVKGQNDFVLIDFPGLGAETSGVRDAFLCLRELEDVQTILILLNANKPGAGEAQEIFNLMQQHHADLQNRVLVGVSRCQCNCQSRPTNGSGCKDLSFLSLSPPFLSQMTTKTTDLFSL